MRSPWYAYLPALALIAGLTAWAVLDRPSRPAPAWRSPRAVLVRDVIESLRRFERQVEHAYQGYYASRHAEIRSRHEAKELGGDALKKAIDSDPDMAPVRKFSGQLTLLLSGGNLWAKDLEALAGELDAGGSAEAEAEIWKGRVALWRQLSPTFREGTGKWKQALEEAGLPPATAADELIAAIDALSAAS